LKGKVITQKTNESVHHLAQVWKEWTLDYMDKCKYVVSYGNLLSHPDKEIDHIQDLYGLTRKSKVLEIGKMMKKGADVPGNQLLGNKDFKKKKYYINKEYMKGFSPQQIKMVMNIVPDSLKTFMS